MSDEDQGNLAHPCGPWRITEPSEPKLVDLWSVADLRDALATMQAERDTAIRQVEDLRRQVEELRSRVAVCEEETNDRA